MAKRRMSQKIGEHDVTLSHSTPPDGEVARWKMEEKDRAEETREPGTEG